MAAAVTGVGANRAAKSGHSEESRPLSGVVISPSLCMVSPIRLNTFKGLWAKYSSQLEAHPFRTQITTSLLLWGVGDAVTQTLKIKRANKSQQLLSQSSSTQSQENDINTRQLLTSSMYGASFVGPVGHMWYTWIDQVASRNLRPGSLRFVASKVAADTVLFGPIHVAAFFLFTGIAMGGTLHAACSDLRRNFLPTYISESVFWTALQAANFSLVPVRHHLLVVNLACVIESAFLSWVKHSDGFGSLAAMLAKKSR
eukprot:jgi/Mesvir1/21742/Mv04151-RA.1